MKVQSLGHVVLRVTDLARSEAFYSGLLGLEVCARFDDQGMKMTFFTLGNHHDLAISEVSGAEDRSGGQAAGLDHVAFCIGTSMEELKEANGVLGSAGIAVNPSDHDVTRSLYFDDPDGNTIEFYVDVSDAWREDPQRIAKAEPLEI
jgi:catechol 2,3-dioxygenase